MRDDDEFPFIKDLPRRRVSLPVAERAALVRLGLLETDVAALERVLPYLPEVEETRAEARRAFVEAMLHFRRHGAKILKGLGLCFDEILGRNWPATVGADTLFGMARGGVQGFEITNDLRPFYVRILAAKRPEAVHRLDFGSSWADLLIVARWSPITTGKDNDDALATPTGSPTPTPRPMATTSTSTGGDQ